MVYIKIDFFLYTIKRTNNHVMFVWTLVFIWLNCTFGPLSFQKLRLWTPN